MMRHSRLSLAALIGLLVLGTGPAGAQPEDDAPPRDRRDRGDDRRGPATRDAEDGRRDDDRPGWRRGRRPDDDGLRREGDGGRFRDRAGPPRPDDRDAWDLPPERVREMMDFTQREFPRLHDRLAEARERSDRDFKRSLRFVAPRMLEMMHQQRENPELGDTVIAQHRVEWELFELRHRHKCARTPEEREETAHAIREKLMQSFDLRVRRLALEIKQMEQRLEQAKADLADQQENKQPLIERQFKDFLNDDRPPPPPGDQPPPPPPPPSS